MKQFVIWALCLVLITGLIASCAGDDDDNDDAGDDDTPTGDDDATATDPLDEVNPFIGTGGGFWGMGAMMPGSLAPNGLVKLTPDTAMGDFYISYFHAGGYWYPDNSVRGISHLHLPGTGIADLANINVMPVTQMNDERVTMQGYRSPFSHQSEEARPAYYKVHLDRFDVDVELTATENVGYHRWTFPEGGDPHAVVDVSYSVARYTTWWNRVWIDHERNEVVGFAYQAGGFSRIYMGMPIYFVARFSEPIVDYGTFVNNERLPGNEFAEGLRVGAYVGFAPGTRHVEAKVAISVIGPAQARANLEAQVPHWDFDAVVAQTESKWRDRLADIVMEGGTETQRRIFQTAMYHLYVLPTTFTEAEGRYLGFDREVHEVDDFTYYSDLSLWDTFRTLHPLMALVRPDLNRDFVLSMQRMYEQRGAYPRWAQGVGETTIMIGTHADTMIADAYLKGTLRDVDIHEIYAGLREHAVGHVPIAERVGIEDWLALGYVAHDNYDQSVSRTQEFSLNDYCLARLAEAIGEDEDAEMFYERSRNYRNLWDPDTLFFRPKMSDGTWFEAWSEDEWRGNLMGYTEGNARHWRWMVMHDPEDLIDLMGGPETFAATLDDFMERGIPPTNDIQVDPYYWHGNEPDEHAPYFFAFAERPDLTAKWVRWIMANKYADSPLGLDGNDDGGSLSAWYIFSALGFFPLPCTNLYVIGSPLFPEGEMRIGENTLTILAPDTSETNQYVKSVTLNGRTLAVPWFDHEEIAAGGTLEFEMTSDPLAGRWEFPAR
ncbi:MAG: GH92 family glycosyl hydrolase [Candidatus Lernaella stagnicola]|nr:GH92 family glycosyl hydrolase [Candidatus Lernaella stagnicola]